MLPIWRSRDTVTWLKGNHNLTGGASWTNYNVWLKNSGSFRAFLWLLANDPASRRLLDREHRGRDRRDAVADAADANPESVCVPDGRMSQITSDARLNERHG